MKKIVVIIGLVSLVSSCKKVYTCTCDYLHSTRTVPYDQTKYKSYISTITYPTSKVTKFEASNQCIDETIKTSNQYTVAPLGNTITEINETKKYNCKLK